MDTECVDTEDLKVFVSGYAGFGVFRVSPAGRGEGSVGGGLRLKSAFSS